MKKIEFVDGPLLLHWLLVLAVGNTHTKDARLNKLYVLCSTASCNPARLWSYPCASSSYRPLTTVS